MKSPLSSQPHPSRRDFRAGFRRLMACGVAAVGLWNGSARATAYYWDDNGATAGTSTAPSGTLGTDAFLSTSATGSTATTVVTPTAADTVQFVARSATTDTTSGSTAFTVDVNGTQNVSSIVFQNIGAFTLGATANASTLVLNGATGLNIGRSAGTSNIGLITVNSTLQLAVDQTWGFSLISAGVGATNATIAGAVTGTGNLTVSPTTNRVLLFSGGMSQTGNFTVNGSNGAVTVSGNLANTGNLTVSYGSAASSLNLTRAAGNTLSGTTSITGGTLNITNTSGSATGAGNVTVSAAVGNITGAGITTGLLTVTNAGQLTPGSSGAAGTLTLGSTGGLALTSAALNLNLSASATAGNDQIKTGTLTLGSTLTINLVQIGSTGNALSTTALYTLIDANGTAALDLTGTTITTNFSGFSGSYTPTYSSNATGDLLVSFAAVPEPSTYAGVSLLLALLVWRERKRFASLYARRAVR